MNTTKKEPGVVGGQGRAQSEIVNGVIPAPRSDYTHFPADVNLEQDRLTSVVPRIEGHESLEGILAPHHLAMLREKSGISDGVISTRGYRTISDPNELSSLGFSPVQCRVPGLLIPVHTPDGGNTLYAYRPDNPRVVEERNKKKRPDGTNPCKVIKYEMPKGSSSRLDCPPNCQPMLANPAIPLWITEGQKKADALASRGLCAIDLLGVWNFKGKNEFGGTTLLADFDHIAFEGREVRLIYDSDVMTKPLVRQALKRLTEHLQRKKALVTEVFLPPGPDGKVGVDDWLAQGHTVEDLEALVEAPRPQPQPAPPSIEILDNPPVIMRRPLALIEGRAYAATWPYVKVTIRESVNKQGEVFRYDPPKVEAKQQLLIVRDDGMRASGNEWKTISEPGLEVMLPEIPQSSRIWQAAGVKAYIAGERPDPLDVFSRIVAVVNRFVDFDRSLADQQTMAELVA